MRKSSSRLQQLSSARSIRTKPWPLWRRRLRSGRSISRIGGIHSLTQMDSHHQQPDMATDRLRRGVQRTMGDQVRFMYTVTDLYLRYVGLPTVHQNAYVQGNSHAPPPPPSGQQGFGNGAPQGYNFQYSACTGRRKALLIGINYFGTKSQLRGCINDVKNMSTYLNGNFGYAREDMVILTDDQQNPMSQPTKQNMLRAMHWLVKDAQQNDSLFFHYSGNMQHPGFQCGCAKYG